MLTSPTNHQYLRPEYLTPLATTLDSKKSPLALLVQTCSQIGVDPPAANSNNKSSSSLLTPSSDKSAKSKDSSNGRDKASPLHHHTPSHNHHHHNSSSASSTSSLESAKSASSFKPYESCITRDHKAASASPDIQQQPLQLSQPQQQQRVPSAHSNSGGSRSRTPAGKQRCSSNQSASSSGGRDMGTPQGRKSSTPGNDQPTRDSPNSRTPAASSSPSSLSKPAFSPAHSVLSSQDYFRSSALSLIASSAASSGATTTTTSSAAAYGLPYPPQFPPMDPLTANSLLAQHHAAAALKNGLAGNPYLTWRMKTPAGTDPLVCRDPYCTGCQLNPGHPLSSPAAAGSPVNGNKPPTTPTSQAAGTNGACPAGCTQCDHKPNSSSAAAAAAVAAAAASSSPYAAYAHAHFVALAAASQMPYACNWIGADAAYCGKRFSNSEELLQHIRTHTSLPSQAGSESNAAAAAALSLLTPPGLAPGHPLLSRTYPTPPLSPLAAARYHPYGKPYGVPPPMGLGLPLGPPPVPHPAAAGLAPFFSPYAASLYANSRLGSAPGMHP